jgi:hypothetical protein
MDRRNKKGYTEKAAEAAVWVTASIIVVGFITLIILMLG